MVVKELNFFGLVGIICRAKPTLPLIIFTESIQSNFRQYQTVVFASTNLDHFVIVRNIDKCRFSHMVKLSPLFAALAVFIRAPGKDLRLCHCH